ncbi:MAG: UDP-N-acetylglucosamine pyrophosphorylase [Clostridiales bacterium]|nr:UDP-N-acetylglucosamine pyrophosphorylase [Clostridiales bacterium]
MKEALTCRSLLSLDKTIAGGLFADLDYPWQALPRIADFIRSLGPTLDPAVFDHPADDVWIAKSAAVYPSAHWQGPLIVDENAEIRHCAFIRGSAIVGKRAVVGNSTELKNCVLFDGCQVPHFNYVGDSILGHKAHLGAGAITSNVRSDKGPVRVRGAGIFIETGLRKFGAIVGDGAEVGCNAVLNPGAVVGRGAIVYPTSCVRGVVPERHIHKNSGEVTAIASHIAEV